MQQKGALLACLLPSRPANDLLGCHFPGLGFVCSIYPWYVRHGYLSGHSLQAWWMALQVKACVIDGGARVGHPDLTPNIVKGFNMISDQAPDNYDDTNGQ